jgi:hypothetical protein
MSRTNTQCFRKPLNIDPVRHIYSQSCWFNTICSLGCVCVEWGTREEGEFPFYNSGWLVLLHNLLRVPGIILILEWARNYFHFGMSPELSDLEHSITNRISLDLCQTFSFELSLKHTKHTFKNKTKDTYSTASYFNIYIPLKHCAYICMSNIEIYSTEIYQVTNHQFTRQQLR